MPLWCKQAEPLVISSLVEVNTQKTRIKFRVNEFELIKLRLNITHFNIQSQTWAQVNFVRLKLIYTKFENSLNSSLSSLIFNKMSLCLVKLTWAWWFMFLYPLCRHMYRTSLICLVRQVNVFLIKHLYQFIHIHLIYTVYKYELTHYLLDNTWVARLAMSSPVSFDRLDSIRCILNKLGWWASCGPKCRDNH